MSGCEKVRGWHYAAPYWSRDPIINIDPMHLLPQRKNPVHSVGLPEGSGKDRAVDVYKGSVKAPALPERQVPYL